jgi:hypothetical protein
VVLGLAVLVKEEVGPVRVVARMAAASGLP